MNDAHATTWSGRTLDVEFRGHRGFDLRPDADGGHIALSEVGSLTSWMLAHSDRQTRDMADEAEATRAHRAEIELLRVELAEAREAIDLLRDDHRAALAACHAAWERVAELRSDQS